MVLLAPPTAQVLVEDRDQDQHEAEQPHQVEQRFLLLGHAADRRQRRAVDRLEQEGRREQQEEHRRDQRGHRDGAEQELPHGYSASITRPYSSTAIATSATEVRSSDRS